MHGCVIIECVVLPLTIIVIDSKIHWAENDIPSVTPIPLRTIGAVVHGGSTIFCSGSPVGCMKPWKFQVGYSEIGCEVRQFYLNVSILFVLLLSIQVNVISLVQK